MNIDPEFAEHTKHVQDCEECMERLMILTRLEMAVESLKGSIGSKPFLITADELEELAFGETCPTCWSNQIAKLNGGTK